MSLTEVVKYGRFEPPRRSFWAKRIQWMISMARPLNGMQLNSVEFKWAAHLSLLYLCGVAAIFTASLYYAISSSVSQKFLSLSNSDPNMVCQPVLVRITSEFQATFDGYWSTSPKYHPNASIFEIHFSGGSVTLDQYRSVMSSFAVGLAKLGKIAVTENVFFNYLQLTVYGERDESTGIEFYYTADPAVFFAESVVQTAVLSSAAGTCFGGSGFIYGEFNRAKASLELNLPFTVNERNVLDSLDPAYRTFIQEPCPAQGPFVFTAFTPSRSQFSGGVAGMAFDVRSIIVAIGLNLGMMSSSGSTDLVIFRNEFTARYQLYGVVDPWYQAPQMQSVYCIDKTSSNFFTFTAQQVAGPEICFVVSSTKSSAIIMYYPVGNQVARLRRNGNEKRRRQVPCTCDAPLRPSGKASDWFYCERANFFVGLFYQLNFNKTMPAKAGQNPFFDTLSFGIEQQMRIFANPVSVRGGFSKIMQPFTDLFTATGLIGQDPLMEDKPVNSDWGQNRTPNEFAKAAWAQINSWAPSSGMGAVLFQTVSIRGDISFNLPMNKYVVQLSSMAQRQDQYFDWSINQNASAVMCQDALTQSTAMARLGQEPPVSLTENYYTCAKSPLMAIQSSLGASVAATNLYVSVLWASIGFMAFMYIKRKHRHDKTKSNRDVIMSAMSRKEVEAVLQELKDETLVAALRDLHRRLERIDKAGQSQSSLQSAQTWARFRRFHQHDLSAVYEERDSSHTRDYELVASEVSQRLASLLAKRGDMHDDHPKEDPIRIQIQLQAPAAVTCYGEQDLSHIVSPFKHGRSASLAAHPLSSNKGTRLSFARTSSCNFFEEV